MSQQILLASYNICHGYGMDKKVDIPRIAAVINRFKPTCLALQEVDNAQSRSAFMDETAELARLTGMHGFFGKATKMLDGEYGIAILTANPATVACIIPLPGDERRTFLAVDTTSPDGKPFRFACTHFDLVDSAKEISARIICDSVIPTPIPCALMGDFNCYPDSTPFNILASKWHAVTATPLPSWPSDNPTMPIDHCFITPDNAWGPATPSIFDERVASDHRPLLVTTSLV